VRTQLITQFFSESVLVSCLAFMLSIILVLILLPTFNNIADKRMTIPWSTPAFWIAGIGFTLVTGLFAGVYPALYLSSFQPVKVLKGTFKVGRLASLPRKVLVVVQFTISITLIIGTIVVYRQIEHGQNRPIGYNRDGLINVYTNEERLKHAEVIYNELKTEGAIIEMAASHGPITDVWNTNGGFDWA
jgi:hypothetical protein